MSNTSGNLEYAPSIKQFLIGGLVAGLLATVLNNIYSVIYTAWTGFSIPEIINPISVTLASIVPLLTASCLYYLLERFTTKGTTIFVILAVVVTIVSFAGPLGSSLPDGTPTPDGFAGLTLPMHIFAGLAVIIVIPTFVRRVERRDPRLS